MIKFSATFLVKYEKTSFSDLKLKCQMHMCLALQNTPDFLPFKVCVLCLSGLYFKVIYKENCFRTFLYYLIFLWSKKITIIKHVSISQPSAILSKSFNMKSDHKFCQFKNSSGFNFIIFEKIKCG